jgi:hypothetical protein
MQLFIIFIIGTIILIGAILLNLLAGLLGFTTWYEFIRQPSAASVVSLLWLFVVYPLALGFIAYTAAKIFL